MRNQRTARTALRSTRKATISDHESFLRTRKFEFDLELSVSTESPNPLAEVARFYRDAPIGSRIIHTTHWTALDVNRTECETGRGTPLLRRSRGRLSSTIVICYLVRLLKMPRRIPETHPFLLLAPQQAEVTTSLRTFSATCNAQKLGEMATPPIPDAAICLPALHSLGVPASSKRSDEVIPATQFQLTPHREASGRRPDCCWIKREMRQFRITAMN